MIDALIGEGDKIIVDPSREAKNGDIVAAIVDNEWTVKYFYRRNGKVELVPANKQYPVIYPKESLEIGGVVISVIRKYY
jgi:SOS-response transcriptional repressor LexA